MMNRSKGLFINADDFCLTDGITKAIIDLSRNNKIQSASVVVNNNDICLKDNLKLLNNVDIGLHINLTQGKPISEKDQVRSLLNRNGVFFNHKQLWLRYMLGLVKKEEIFLEVANQYNSLLKYIKVSFIDSHKHIHCYPFLGDIILKCLLNIGVKNIRNPFPIQYKQKKYFIFKLFCLRREWRLLSSQFEMPEGMISLHKVNDIRSVISKYENRNVEIVVHPSMVYEGGYLDNSLEYRKLLEQ